MAEITREQLSERVVAWLRDAAIPLWGSKGLDREQGGFFESLSLEGEPLIASKRAMVQSRQIYVFRTAYRLGLIDRSAAESAVSHGTRFLMDRYSHPSGGFIHSVDRSGKADREAMDLYAQAFALFGLAQAFGMVPDPRIRERAKSLLGYLDSKRRVSGGGYSELIDGEPAYEANPHMHLFEAALAWMEVDSDPVWRRFAVELKELCLGSFVRVENGADLLCEHFLEGWRPKLQGGRFVFEPGHHFEWSWLLGRFADLVGDVPDARARTLFEVAERVGVDHVRRAAHDEVWSDLTPKTRSSRFWPQCERIKAAVSLGEDEVADESMRTLFRFLDTPVSGGWFDQWLESGEFTRLPYKASSLYHIIGAMAEYLTPR